MEIRKRCGHATKVVLWDERYTSKEARSRIAAEAMARYCRIPGKNELSGELDADCACIILENYYADEGWLYAEEIRLDEISIQECDIIYARNLELNEKIRLQRLEEQGRRRNARREMIDRDMALTKRLGGVEEDISTKSSLKSHIFLSFWRSSFTPHPPLLFQSFVSHPNNPPSSIQSTLTLYQTD